MIVNIDQYESGSTHICYWRYFFIKNSIYRQKLKPGGLFGLGLFNSRQKHFYLPEPQTDFIFSIISEELGIVGILVVASFFIFILYCGIRIALNSKNLFAKYLSFGMTFQILIQAVMNLMVVVGLIPVTGYKKHGGTKYNLLKPFVLKEKMMYIEKYKVRKTHKMCFFLVKSKNSTIKNEGNTSGEYKNNYE